MYNAYTDRYIRRGGVILLELCDRIACSGTVLYCSKRGPSVSDCSGQTTVNADMAVTDAIVGDSVAAASDEMDRALHGGGRCPIWPAHYFGFAAALRRGRLRLSATLRHSTSFCIATFESSIFRSVRTICLGIYMAGADCHRGLLAEDDEVHVELLAPRPCPISPSVQRRRPLSAPAASSLWLTLAGTALVVVVMTLVATHLPSTQKTTSAMTSAIDSDPDACDVFCQVNRIRFHQCDIY